MGNVFGMEILSDSTRWQAVSANNKACDGLFVYAVKTTGVYCKPSCKSRLPKRENVHFYNTSASAEYDGFRPCKRCYDTKDLSGETAAFVTRACVFISESEELLTLDRVAAHAGLSVSRFHRVFTRALGISPRRFADAVRQKRFRLALKNGGDIAGALYEAGYGSSSRVYEFASRYLGMTPRRYKYGGKDQVIWHTIVECPLGQLLIAATVKGICAVSIGDDANTLRLELFREFHAARPIEQNEGLRNWNQALIKYLAGKGPWPLLPYDVKATAFQRKVWDWLRTIPPGETYSYSDVAKAIGKPGAARAVAKACAANSVALVIPCHRIVPKSGRIGGYRWKAERKKKLLNLEKEYFSLKGNQG